MLFYIFIRGLSKRYDDKLMYLRTWLLNVGKLFSKLILIRIHNFLNYSKVLHEKKEITSVKKVQITNI